MQKEPEITCTICLCPSPISDSLTLSCNHRFCRDCLVGDWTNNISQGFVDPSKLKCPDAECKVPITYDELKANLPVQIFQKYEDFSFNAFMINENKEKTVICPEAKCQTKSFIWAGASFFTCWKCKNKYCAECMGDWKEHEGISCQNYKENQQKNLNKDEVAFENMMQHEKWMKCPSCKSVVEKIEFCNFIRCSSNICQKKTAFCYLCGDILEEADHYEHFKNKNPYENQCVNSNKKRPQNQNIDPNKKKKAKKVLGQSCPGCLTKDPDKCEILWEKFTKCENKKCPHKGKIVCLICKRKVFEPTEGELIFEHGESCRKKNLPIACKCLIF